MCRWWGFVIRGLLELWRSRFEGLKVEFECLETSRGPWIHKMYILSLHFSTIIYYITIYIIHSLQLHSNFDKYRSWRTGKYRLEKGRVRWQRKCAVDESLCRPNTREDNRPKGSKTSSVRKRFIRFWSPLIYYLGTTLSTTVLLPLRRLLPSPVCGTPLYSFYISEQISFNINVTAEAVAISRRGRLYCRHIILSQS